MAEYIISYSADGSRVTVDSGMENRVNYTFPTVFDLPEDHYTFTLEARDLAENAVLRSLAFTIDRTAPEVAILQPVNNMLYGSDRNLIKIKGVVREENLQNYVLRFGSGPEPETWTQLLTGDGVPPDPELFTWAVGNKAGIPDGLYTISLYARDKAGWETEARVQTTIDNTSPGVSITWPPEGGVVKAPGDIRGSVEDLTLENYLVEMAAGECTGAFKWTALKTSAASVQDGTLAAWQPFPSDGTYCLRIKATDRLGNSAADSVTVRIDTKPPAAPLLAGELENKTGVRLSWMQGVDSDIAGYRLYRNQQPIVFEIITGTDYLDPDLAEGQYVYTVKAVDYAGWESEPSNEVKLKIDLTGPNVKITSPKDGSVLGGLVDIKGTAFSSDDFRLYRVFTGQGQDPSAWNLIRTSPLPTSYGVLTQWDTQTLAGGPYSIKLEAEDLSGNVNSHQITVTIDSTPPSAPLLVSAIADASDVDIAWQANDEDDLAGYLLYRNGRLANAGGNIINDLTPYVLSGTTYRDEDLPDGMFNFVLVAIDKAGNMSAPSNAIAVTIDMRPPAAVIVFPSNNYRFENMLTIQAESPDLDVAGVQFQYKMASDGTWVDLGNADTAAPFISNLNPQALGLTYDQYQLRAVATDTGGLTDQSPEFITVIYTDTSPPGAPIDLTARTNGKQVTLNWSANNDSDLDGYNVYEITAQERIKHNPAIVPSPNFTLLLDGNEQIDGNYTFEVTAIDVYDNESRPSNPVTVDIYTPVVEQPFTPTSRTIISIDGLNVRPADQVELFVDAGSGIISQGTFEADDQGQFSGNVALQPGPNIITARATDTLGNISSTSSEIIVVSDQPPDAPTGLNGSAGDDEVNLTWDPNSEADLIGYHVYRDEQKLNGSMSVTTGTATASNGDYYADRAFDGDPLSYWYCYLLDDDAYGWWQINLESATLISRIEVEWNSESYSARDYEIQVWTGYDWLALQKVTGNEEKTNNFEIRPAYRTDKVRIYITDSNYEGYYSYVLLSEVGISQDKLIAEPSFTDSPLVDGEYTYRVTALDEYGFESSPSEERTFVVGDISPPGPPVILSAGATASEIELAWTESTADDLLGYHVYRRAGQDWIRLTQQPLTEIAFTDAGLTNGTYIYMVTALDLKGNESSPSNEASATVAVIPPQTPIQLHVDRLAEGGQLLICWENAGGNPMGYFIYRGTSPGGPYEKITDAPAGETCYLDSGLVNGEIYYYTVTAADNLGNESIPAEEISQTPQDLVAPAAPVLFMPTISGIPLHATTPTVDVGGWAEPGAGVELFKNGISVGNSLAGSNDLTDSFEIEQNARELAVSPDDKLLAYVRDNNAIVIDDIFTGTAIAVLEDIENLNSIHWSQDGRKLAYTYFDELLNSRIAIYKMDSGITSIVSDESGVNDYDPSWSRDGNLIAFLSDRSGSNDVWMKNLVTGEVARVTDDGNIENFSLAPNGKQLAFINLNGLVIFDLATKNSISVIEGGVLPAWSPDSTRLAFTLNRVTITVIDVRTLETTQLADTNTENDRPYWSPDGQIVLYCEYDSESYGQRIWMVPADGETAGRLVPDTPDNFSMHSWSQSGSIYYSTSNELYRLIPRGHFSFKDVELSVGENILHATAKDSAGNLSPPSGEIFITLDQEMLPDLAIYPQDIYLYPAAPLDGEMLKGSIFVRNSGGLAAENAAVEIYIWESSGRLELVKSEILSTLEPGQEVLLQFDWDSTGKAGLSTIFVDLDVDDVIFEASEDNNFVARDFHVVNGEEINLSTTLDSDIHGENQDMTIHVDLHNSGPQTDGVLSVRVVDTDQKTVAVIDEVGIVLPYGFPQTYSLVWNTGTTFAGQYQVQTIFTDYNGLTIEKIVPFTITPTIQVETLVSTDQILYGSNEDAQISISLTNGGLNAHLEDLTVRINVMDSDDKVMLSEEQTVSWMMPTEKVTLHTNWNTASNSPGNYRVSVEILFDGTVVETAEKPFGIDFEPHITGTLAATPAVVFPGNSVMADYTVHNSGNASAGELMLSLLVLDPQTQAVLHTEQQPIELVLSQQKTGQFVIPTLGLGLKTYTLILQAEIQTQTQGQAAAGAQTLASASFTVRDGLPPWVTVISPVEGTTYESTIDLSVDAVDNALKINLVEYRVDEGIWRPLPAVDPSAGRFSTIWQPTEDDEGSHIVEFRAADNAGNVSLPVAVAFVIELTPPFKKLGGTIAVDPAAVYRGQPVNIAYEIANPAKKAVNDLLVQILIREPDTGEIKDTLADIINLAATSTAKGSLTASTLLLAPQNYEVVLQIDHTEADAPRSLDATAFEVLKSLEVNQTFADPVNLLVWINDDCKASGFGGHDNDHRGYDGDDHDHRKNSSGRNDSYRHDRGYEGYKDDYKKKCNDDDDADERDRSHDGYDNNDKKKCNDRDGHEGSKDNNGPNNGDHDKYHDRKQCTRVDLLESILAGAVADYLIVNDRRDFENELRNPYFTDILIIGDKQSLTEHYPAELQEKVFSGTGLITSHWMKHGSKGEWLGFEYEGSLSSKYDEVQLIDSPITVGGGIQVAGKSYKVKEQGLVTIAGWITDSKRDYPAVVLSEYGAGKTVYLAFDLGQTLDEETYDQLAALITSAIAHVHQVADTIVFYPYRFVPLEMNLDSLGIAMDLEISEAFDPELTLYDPASAEWIADNPWVTSLQLDPAEAVMLRHYYLTPDFAGSYAVDTEVSASGGGTALMLDHSNLELPVVHDITGLIDQIIADLNLIEADKKDEAKVRNAVKDLEKVRNRTVQNEGDVDQNIHDALKAIEGLRSVEYVDLTDIILKTDMLLRCYQGLYYFY